MSERTVTRGDVRLHVRIDGPDDPAAPTLVFANSLGTNLHLWDPLLPHLPAGLRLIRWDLRGHGRSSVPAAPYAMGQLVSDAEAVMVETGARDAVFVGLSVGGMIAQGLATKRLDLVRAVVLSNTAARIGHKALWADRIAAVRRQGLAPLADGILERWFSRGFHESAAVRPWREMLVATPAEGYAGCCAGISGSDFLTTTAALRLPALGIAGSEDGSTPPDLVRETIDLIPGSRFELIRGAGHLPHVEQPERFAEILAGFLREIGHL